MKNAQIFCSACDRQVRVMLSEKPTHDSHAMLHDEEVVCLEIGDQCTGRLCPIGAAAPHTMVERLARNGLPADDLRTVNAICPSCGLVSEMVLYGGGKAACTICGAEARWLADHIEPAD